MGDESNIHFPDMAGGFLSSNTGPSERSQTVRGADATKSASGYWNIRPHNRRLTYDSMVVTFNIAPETGYALAELPAPWIGTVGLTEPDFNIGFQYDTGEGNEFIDIPMSFLIQEIPRNR